MANPRKQATTQQLRKLLLNVMGDNRNTTTFADTADAAFTASTNTAGTIADIAVTAATNADIAATAATNAAISTTNAVVTTAYTATTNAAVTITAAATADSTTTTTAYTAYSTADTAVSIANNTAALVSENATEIVLTDLDAEVKALKKRLEILTLRRQIEELERPPNSRRQGRLEFGDIEHALPKFNGDDVTYHVRHFLRDIEKIMESSDDNIRLLALCRSLTGTARVFLSTTASLNYQALKAALSSEFDVGITRQEVYKMLSQRCWKRKENTLHCYTITMQAIAKRANIADTELIDFIIDGIGNTTPHAHVLMTARSVEELKTLINRYQHKYFETGAVQPSNQRQTRAPKQSDDLKLKCINCSRNGHIKPNCPFPLRPDGSCFRCWKMGHDHRSCPNPVKLLKRREVATVAEDEDDQPGAIGAFNSSD
ncbi:PREDICTED: uncharacterized protein LOC108359017 [Rhagoletis zephyria]|uniref:uncharacterized protein LOC108359017 n=1 Tax=Rhagoletis zephyria TaxID=28612 RepID=UPI00081159A8|nr:PREDICTED: uncharacterized protein LOC108359017 [Rhagoletis zephyria]